MHTRNLILSLSLILACSFSAAAEEVYKRVGPDGMIEFSDRPSSDADKIEVNPNVVQTNPVKPRTPSSSSPSRSESSERQVRAKEGEEADNARASTRRESTERARNTDDNPYFVEQPNNREAVVESDPNPGRATRNAVRNAPAGR
jgi:hypothetical protein